MSTYTTDSASGDDALRQPDEVRVYLGKLPWGNFPRMKWALFCRECWGLRLRYKPSRLITNPRRHG